jgi:hypothetical protein
VVFVVFFSLSRKKLRSRVEIGLDYSSFPRRSSFTIIHPFKNYIPYAVEGRLYELRNHQCVVLYLQSVMDTVVNPPMPGEPSYEQYMNEKKAILNSLAERAKMVAETFNSIEGVSCNEVQGAMYAFPKVNYLFQEQKY